MPDLFTVQHREVGMLRIYLKPSDKIGPRRFWGAKPLYRELIRTAKADGIINAVAQNTHYASAITNRSGRTARKLPIRI